MRTTLALAIAAILASTALSAQTAPWKGQQGTADAPVKWLRIGAGRSSAACAGSPPTQLTELRLSQAARQTTPELNVVVDFKKNAVSGSMVLPSVVVSMECGPPKLLGCGKLKVEDGRIQGRMFTFTTYRTLDGVRIPTRWEGEELSGGGLSYRSIDPVPCQVPQPLISSSGRIPPSAPMGSPLVFHRGDGAKVTKTAGAPSVAGKWWTIDGRRVVTLALKAGSKNQVSGTINVCSGNEGLAVTPLQGERKVENGSIAGKNFSFETEENVPLLKRRQQSRRLLWTGELVDNDTLRLSNSIGADTCRSPSAVSLTFQQPK